MKQQPTRLSSPSSTPLPTQPTSSPHQTPPTNQPTDKNNKSNKGLIITLVVCIILAFMGVAFGIFGLISSNHKSSEIDGLKSLIAQKDETIANLKQLEASNNPNQNINSENNPNEDLTEEELRAIRDQQRRSDMNRLRAAVTQFQANNNGRLPGHGSNLDGQDTLVLQPSRIHDLPSATDNVAAKLITYYLNSANASENSFIDPDDWSYGLTIIDYDHYKSLTEKTAEHMIYLLHQTNCDPNTGITRSDKPRDFAILYRLESGSLYCLDN